MGPILVSGLINLETTVRVDGFPIPYFPVRYPFFGVRSAVSGVGYNVASALTTLGNDVRFVSLIGRDQTGELVRTTLEKAAISDRFIQADLEQTAQSVILYDEAGRRQINVDLKDLQQAAYPGESFAQALSGCRLAILCNINFSRPFLAEVRQRKIPIATDVHAIGSLDDPYNRDFMEHADILFQSHESLPCPPEDWAAHLMERFGTRIVVIGLGKDGALLGVRDDRFLGRFPAQSTRAVVNTIGAGDALFSSFLHFWTRDGDPALALRRAILFASWKIGEKGAAEGFLSEAELDRAVEEEGREQKPEGRSQRTEVR